MKTRTRVRIASGIYSDACGIAATVKVGRVQREQRFPHGTDVRVMESWQIQTRAELDRERPDPDTPIPVRGTLAGDLPRYLPFIVGRVGYKSDRSHLKAWLPALGSIPRHRIAQVRTIVATQMAAWQEQGISPRTLRHRKRVLRELYQRLDGPRAKLPFEGLKLPRPSDPSPTAVALETIQAVAKSLKAGKRHAKGYGSDSDQTHARFLVRATTGQRPTQIMRAQPTDVDLVRRIWFVRPAKQGRAIPLPLTPDMVKAWRAFIAADAWGAFDTRSFSKTIRRHGWPAGIRPYTLRHTFAIDHLIGGTELGDLQGLLGHRQIETTRRFYGPILLARLKKAGASRKLKLA